MKYGKNVMRLVTWPVPQKRNAILQMATEDSAQNELMGRIISSS